MPQRCSAQAAVPRGEAAAPEPRRVVRQPGTQAVPEAWGGASGRRKCGQGGARYRQGWPAPSPERLHRDRGQAAVTR